MFTRENQAVANLAGQPARYHIHTEYRGETAACADTFHPVSEVSVGPLHHLQTPYFFLEVPVPILSCITHLIYFFQEAGNALIIHVDLRVYMDGGCGWESLMKSVTLGNVTMSHRTREARRMLRLSPTQLIGLPRAQH
ncbi:hypothetical protein EVAR_4695_1 [Eumeta japonica]|uniref:Uncharacterized protein n=1 Tax=Eumeta variegata TaxID=151549 RepID=A0A4C1WPG1_EUMVA|nr:hypothetical protein EVAR_4695_1 [Eumeta japonica]